MRVLPIFLLMFLIAAAVRPALAQNGDPNLRTAMRVLQTTPLIDGHNDLAWAIREHGGDVDAYDLRSHTPGQTDLERLGKGMLGGQFWSVYVPGEYADSGFARVQLEQIAIARRFIEKYPDRFTWALTASDMWKAFGEGRIGSVLGIEGGHVIENSLGALRAYYDLGVRYMTLTHNVTTDWADAALGIPKHGGLTAFGEEVVREMNRVGMLMDLSHTAPSTMSDAIRVSRAPVIFSHSGARGLVDHPRNVPDSILQKLAVNGGVVMVAFAPSFVSQEVNQWYHRHDRVVADLKERFPNDASRVIEETRAWDQAHPAPRATLSQVAGQIEYIRRVAGIDHVGIGGDFDGIGSTPVGLEDVSTYPALFAELARRGWSEEDLRKLAGENILRVMREAEVVAARMQREGRREETGVQATAK
ncbi:MAG TPA: dipeptidase [Rhodothermales bacterium]|nr:dipeptidase [Rhodothermales bacterium]